eukprot:c12073_g1_i1.p1 GENE.c12073_g1_i1~~c12073_g1_i1.p1  ORF type:complete len:182 (-),score=42.12 c12073_g1_i1:25-570(-)
MGALVSFLRQKLFGKNLEMVLVGLDNSGKTTLLQVLAGGHPIDTEPTLGVKIQSFKHGGTQIKAWDIGGQQNYRSEWNRYTKGVDVIMFVIDTAASGRFSEARKELHQLLENEDLIRTPLLVIANKIDLENHATRSELIQILNLDYTTQHPWELVEISALRMVNLEGVFAWLMKQKKIMSK